MSKAQGLSSTQKGALAENIVGNELMLQSQGRLTPFKPMADDDGIDLLIYDKQTRISIPLQVKSRAKGLNKSPNICHFGVQTATFSKSKNTYLIAVLMTEDMRSVERAWLIPMRILPRLARDGKTKFVVRPNWSDSSKDKYSTYRCRDMAEVTQRLLRAFSALKKKR
ncbi:MAG: hypothetical protein KAV00_04565 [Phycisphaerae bacterium]|nr:hypothetical protein [Phycisphaerae bacterium]